MNRSGVVKYTVKERCSVLPEHQVFDFKLGLDDACGPDSDPQHIHLRGHVVWRHNPGHVIKKTRERKTKQTKKRKRMNRNMGLSLLRRTREAAFKFILNNRFQIKFKLNLKLLCLILSYFPTRVLTPVCKMK